MDEVPEPGEIVGPQPPPFGRWRVVALLVAVGLAAWLFARHHDFAYLLYPLWFGLLGIIRHRRPTSISAAGIVRPLVNRRFVPWADVESVVRPAPGVYRVRLNLVGGKTLTLDDIPAAQSGAVAAIGGKELVAAVPLGVPAAAQREVIRSDIEIEADVRRQAAALAEHRKAMKAQSDALHWKPRR